MVGSTRVAAHPPPDTRWRGSPPMLDERLPQTLAGRHVECINSDAVASIDLNPPGSNLRQIQRRAQHHRLSATHMRPATSRDCRSTDTATTTPRIPRDHRSLGESWDQTSTQVWLLGLVGCWAHPAEPPKAVRPSCSLLWESDTGRGPNPSEVGDHGIQGTHRPPDVCTITSRSSLSQSRARPLALPPARKPCLDKTNLSRQS